GLPHAQQYRCLLAAARPDPVAAAAAVGFPDGEMLAVQFELAEYFLIETGDELRETQDAHARDRRHHPRRPPPAQPGTHLEGERSAGRWRDVEDAHVSVLS